MATAVPAPSAATFPGQRSLADMERDILDYVVGVQSDAQSRDLARRSLRFAIDKINSRSWQKLLGYQVIPLFTDTFVYNVDLNFRDPVILQFLDTSGNPDGRIWFKEHKTFDIEHAVTGTGGTPYIYTFRYDTRQVEFDTAPSSTEISRHPNALLRFHRRIAYPVNPGELFDGPPEFASYAIWHACERLSIIRAPNKAEFARSESREQWRDLIRSDNDTQTDWDHG